MEENRVIYTCLIGSRLYGLSNENSDYDYVSVFVGNGKNQQLISGKEDEFYFSFPKFLAYAKKGVPQCLEAMFAPDEFTFYDEISDMRKGYVAAGPDILATYQRTIYNFSLGDTKRRIHGARLAFNLHDLLVSGRFDPRLSEEQKKTVLHVGTEYNKYEYRNSVEEISGVHIFKERDQLND